MDRGLVMFGLFILALGILIPIIQQINTSRKEGFNNSVNNAENLVDAIEAFWQENKTEDQKAAEVKKDTKKVETKAQKDSAKAVANTKKAEQVSATGSKSSATVTKISQESIEKCKKTLGDYAKQLAKEAEIAKVKAQKAAAFAESIEKMN